MKKWLAMYLILIASFLIYVYNFQLQLNESRKSSDPGGLRGEVSEKYVMVTFQAGIDYWKNGLKGFEDAAQLFNVSIEFRGATQYDANEENTVLEQVIARKPAGIAVSAINPDALTTTINKAVDAGIPIVLFDSNAKESKASAFLGTNNYNAGATAARQLANLIDKKGKVAIINQPNQLNHQERTNGFIDTIRQEFPDVKVVAVRDGKGDQLQSESTALSLLQENDDLKGIFATQANGGIGIGNALIRTGKLGKVKVVSFDTDKGTLDMVKNGTLSATIAQGTWNMGYWALQYLFLLHHGPGGEVPLGGGAGGAGSTGLQGLPIYTDTGITVVTSDNVDHYYAK